MLPSFKKIDLTTASSDFKKILLHNRQKLSALLQSRTFSWQNLIMPLDETDNRIHQFLAPIRHLSSVKSSKQLRDVYSSCLTELSGYETELYQNSDLYKAIHAIKRKKTFKKLSAAKKIIINNKLLKFKQNGVTLSQEKKDRLRLIQKKLNCLFIKFSANLLNAKDSWSLQLTNKKQLVGVPTHTIQSVKKGRGYLVTLDSPIYLSILRYADNRNLRKKVYDAYVTLASNQGEHKKVYDNSSIIAEILSLRHELAQLLNYKSFAHYALKNRMAKKPQTVFDFLHRLINCVKPLAKKELKTLKNFGIKKLEPWDIAYYSEKLKKQLFNFNQEELRPYFPINQVLKGLFDCVKQLYGLKIQERKNIDAWHTDVRFFDVYDKKGKRRGGFYTDFYSRPHKSGGAWIEGLINRRKLNNVKIQLPIACLTANFNKPVSHSPALLTPQNLVTLFHEFGHCLHHILDKTDYFNLSPLISVEWDAVELPSKFMENFCWQPEIIRTFARHYQTGKNLPDKLLYNLIESRKFQIGLEILDKLTSSLFDMRLHTSFNPKQKNDKQTQKILDAVRKEVCLIQPPKYDRFPNKFHHIFDHLYPQYAAGYYSYRWAEILSSDAFSRFQSEGIFNKKTGNDFLKHILEKGGSLPAKECFINFRGREPNSDAWLEEIS